MPVIITTAPTDKDLTGQSHWWGAPDLPEDIPYPCHSAEEDGNEFPVPLTFICQIRCSDLSPADKDNLLPHRGMLYFFAPIDHFLGEYGTWQSFRDAPAVIYSPREEGLSPYEMHWEGTEESVFRPAEAISLQYTEAQSLDGMLMLGTPYQDEIADSHPGCTVLLQIDEEDRWGLRFFDCGMYYFLIPTEDLAARRWNRVRGDIFTY